MFEQLTLADGIEVAVVADDGSWTELEIRVDAGVGLDLRLEVPLGMGVGYWHPGAGPDRTLPADWAGRTSTSLVSWAPVGCLHDAAGQSLFAWALDELVDELEIRYGISEEHKTFAVELHGRPAAGARRIGFVSSRTEAPLAESVARLAHWLTRPAVRHPAAGAGGGSASGVLHLVHLHPGPRPGAGGRRGRPGRGSRLRIGVRRRRLATSCRRTRLRRLRRLGAGHGQVP